MKIKQQNSTEIQILDIKEVSFKNKVNKEVIDAFSEEDLQYNIGFFVNAKQKDEYALFNININVSYKLKEIDDIILELETSTSFKLTGFSDDILRIDIPADGETNNGVFVEQNLMHLIFETSIGATRGMISYKTASIPINFTLPLINYKDFIEVKEDES